MKKPILLVLIIFLAISCKKDDAPPTPPKPIDPIGMDDDDNPSINSNDEITLELEGVNSIDYSNVTATSISRQNAITNNGVFDNPYEPNDVQDLPVLLIENEEVLTGYYPNNLSTDKVTIDNFLFYHFKSYPRMLLKNISDNILRSEIKILSNYEDLKFILVSSLNSNVSPLNNEIFIQSIRSFAEKDFTSKTSKDIVGDFYFEYNRNGLVTWPNKIPLFANVGFVIRDKQTSNIVFGPELLRTESLDFGVLPTIKWFKEKFGDPTSRTNSYQLTGNGEYEIILSNGLSGVAALDESVLNSNINDFSALVISLVTAGILDKLPLNDSCEKGLADLLSFNNDFMIRQVNLKNNPTIEEIKTQLQATGAQFLLTIGDCSESTLFFYVSAAIKAALFYLNIGADLYEIQSLIKDSEIVSDINIIEKRFFNNNVSFGELQVTDESEKEFSGVVADDIQYTKTITEKESFYNVESNLILPSSFISDVSNEYAKDLPFKFDIISGDVVISNGPLFKTESDGTLRINMSVGNEDSEVLVYPDFESTVIDETTINLKNLENDVLLIEGNTDFGDVPINQSKKEVFTITNRSDNVMTIDYISTPDGFYSAFSDPNAPIIVIEPQEFKTTIIEFKPTIETTYGGAITISNNVFEENNTISVTGNGIEENNEVDLTGCWNITNTNNISGNCTWENLYYDLSEGGSATGVNVQCVASAVIEGQTITYTINRTNFNLNSNFMGTEILNFNGTFNPQSNSIEGTWNASITNNGTTTTCSGNFTMIKN